VTLRTCCLILAGFLAAACSPSEGHVEHVDGSAAKGAVDSGGADSGASGVAALARSELEAERAKIPADSHYGKLAPLAIADPQPGEAVFTFAGGCFWCTEKPFEKLPGVRAVISGFSGGSETNPTYHDVSYGKTGHTESVQVLYDPAQINFEQLLQVAWRNMDPTDNGGQFVDRGPQYRPEIFVHDARQREIAEASRDALAASGRFDDPIVVPITDFEMFWPAEVGHQDFWQKDPSRYSGYRRGSGRDQFLELVWGDDLHVDIVTPEQPDPPAAIAATERWTRPSDEEIAARLTPLQYEVTQEEGTERAFANAYHDNKREGLYVDIVSGEPLFSSKQKFDSGTGWPSFWQPVAPENVLQRKQDTLWGTAMDVRSKHADSHLAHVFNDGPAPTGLRYCINSAALRFIPVADLEGKGYGEYLELFKD